VLVASAKHPEAPVWYVYQFEVRRVPFYVGIGHHEFGVGRAEDRIRWVCSQVKRELAGKRARWVLHTSVIKSLILHPEHIETRYFRKGLCRAEALRLEKRRITQLVSTGHVLANIQYNRRPLPSVDEIIRFVQRKSKGCGERM
jgi:hypothetical protein